MPRNDCLFQAESSWQFWNFMKDMESVSFSFCHRYGICSTESNFLFFSFCPLLFSHTSTSGDATWNQTMANHIWDTSINFMLNTIAHWSAADATSNQIISETLSLIWSCNANSRPQTLLKCLRSAMSSLADRPQLITSLIPFRLKLRQLIFAKYLQNLTWKRRQNLIYGA